MPMLTIGPSQYHRDDAPCWWVQAHGELVASMACDHAGRWWAHLNLHYATVRGKRVQHVELAGFDTERLEQWARANEARLLRECEPPPPIPPPDLSAEAFVLTPPEARQVRGRPVVRW
jgi:hypothetical protein